MKSEHTDASQSIIVSTTTRLLMPIMLAFSAFMFIRGHNEPGGGFVGGLIAAGALALNELATGHSLIRNPTRLLAAGLTLVTLTALLGPFAGKAVLTNFWAGGIGTPLVFDLGVYLTVIGFVLAYTSAGRSLGDDR
jgi:multicomponent Na+:H+ antiporter subunit B